MKKNLFVLSAIAVPAAALVSCQKEQEIKIEIEPEGVPFEIIAGTAETKTVNDGVHTTWLSTDQINLFHAVHGETTYNDNAAFTATAAGATVSFSGTLKAGSEPTSGNTYDWFALYPYDAGFDKPDGTFPVTITSSMNQTGYNNTEHLAGNRSKLAGKVESVAYDGKPSITMHNLSSVVKVNVKNALAEKSIIIKSVEITAPNKITGKFNLDITGAAPVLSEIAEQGSTKVTLNVNSGTELAVDGIASFYLPIRPFTAAAGSTFTIVVTTNRGVDTIVSSALGSDFEFQAGKIHNMSVNYDVDSPATLPFSITGADGKAGYVGVTGLKVTGVTSSDYSASNTPYLAKWDTNGATLDLYVNSRPGVVSFGVKKAGGATNSSIKVSSSANGADYSDVQTFTIEGAQNAIVNCVTTNEIPSTHRYIRLTYTKGSNIGFGPFSVSAYGAPAISASDITEISAAGVTDATMTYTINNFTGDDDVAVSSFDGIVTAASVSSAGTVTYTVAPNYTTSAKNGTITLNSPRDGATKVINLAQLGETFSVSETTVYVPKDANTATFTVTSASFDWTASVNVASEKNLSADPLSGTKNASARTITVTSTTDSAEEDDIILGTIVIARTANPADDTQKKTITIKKAPLATVLYSCGFELSEGFSTGTNYKTTVTQGPTSPTAKQWQTYYGTVSTSNKITGSNSLAFRRYSEDDNLSVSTMLFDVTGGVTKVQFNAKASASGSAALKLTIEYSTDSGSSWNAVSGYSAKSLTSSAAPYNFSVAGAPEKYRLRFKIDASSTKPSSGNAQMTIDDVKFLKSE